MIFSSSSHLLKIHIKKVLQVIEKIGVTDGARTHDNRSHSVFIKSIKSAV